MLFTLLPACQQQQQLDTCTLEEVRFNGCEQPEREEALARLMVAMEEHEPSAECDADDLATRSMLVLGNSPAAFLTAEELENAEDAYLELEKEQRIRLAAEVMNALLSAPAQNVNGKRLRSYDRVDVSPWMSKAGEFFAPCEDECIAADRTALFKRMVARIMLEDVACNTTLEMDERCAAVECLQYICREGLLIADGSWDKVYMIDGLPLNGRCSRLELALFGCEAWEKPQS